MSTKKKTTTKKTTAAKTAKTAPATKAAATKTTKTTAAKTTTVKATAKAKVAPKRTYTAEQIAERAYYLWLERGENHGNDVEDWLTAEKELTAAV